MNAMLLLLATLTIAPSTDAARTSLDCSAGDRSVDLLLDALHDQDEDVRWLAANLLGSETGANASAVDALANVVDDRSEHWRVRSSAATSLAELAGDGATDVLADAVADHDDDWRVRAAALEALWSTVGCGGVSQVIAENGPLCFDNGRTHVTFDPAAAVEHEGFVDPDPRVRRLATLASAVTEPRPDDLADALCRAVANADTQVARSVLKATCRAGAQGASAALAVIVAPCQAPAGTIENLRSALPAPPAVLAGDGWSTVTITR